MAVNVDQSDHSIQGVVMLYRWQLKDSLQQPDKILCATLIHALRDWRFEKLNLQSL